MNVTALLDAKGRDVATISKDRSVADAVALMRERSIGALVVVGAGRIQGILSERDVVRTLATDGSATLTQSVGDLMSTDITTAQPDTSCTELMGLMTERRIRHVPVTEGGYLVGLVSIGDIVKARFEELEREKRDLLDYVTAR